MLTGIFIPTKEITHIYILALFCTWFGIFLFLVFIFIILFCVKYFLLIILGDFAVLDGLIICFFYSLHW